MSVNVVKGNFVRNSNINGECVKTSFTMTLKGSLRIGWLKHYGCSKNPFTEIICLRERC